MILTVKDIIGSKFAAYHSEGLKVYEILRDNLDRDQSCIISFNLIEACSSMFLNASIGKLYLTIPSEKIEKYISYQDTNQLHTFDYKLHEVIDNALHHDSFDKIVEEAILA